MIEIVRDRRGTWEKEKEKQKTRKSQTTAINMFLFLPFLEKFKTCLKTYLEKPDIYHYICVTVFCIVGYLMKQQRPSSFALVFQTPFLDQNTR